MSKKEIWFHGTSASSANAILKSRKFKTGEPINGANFGKGVYLTNCENYAKTYGDTVIEVEVDMDSILDLPLKQYSEICKEINGHWLTTPLSGKQMEELTRKNGKIGVVQEREIRDTTKKMCIHEQDTIKIIGIRK
ncbi:MULTISPECIES: hypothetical protein [Bacillus cereus group]|uniref:hypothetical protein n=1 Tax=Bacillus cereus group TaxID=86661 RepID=UPI000BF3FA56|nr:hypothetical protein [Bacillus cereus]PFJ30614.1 hypothetical protein COI92_06385 [Bacillus anthracis]PGW00644.1 hypothetical protein COD87_30690 [Bacillus cereus]